jgi:hypothetical protein
MNQEGIMRLSVKSSGLGLLLAIPLLAGDPATVSLISNYNNWGWSAYELKNGLVTLAVVPAIGARGMRYDLGSHASMYVNSSELGKTYTPQQGGYHNFGGFKNWPSPQYDGGFGWPPPQILDYGTYDAQIESNTADSVSITVTSPLEKWLTPNLRFKRTLTVYRNSSRVKVEQTLINEGATSVEHGVWDNTQSIANHTGVKDFQNFWVYFPINPESVNGASGVRTDGASGAWKGEVAPGIYGVRTTSDGKKLFADPPEGWICYVDERDGYAYVKTFDVYPNESYPDQVSRIAVYLGNPYVEVEVTGPLVQLAANGGQTTFTENWWAAKANGPILAVNEQGVVTKNLTYDAATGIVSATCGLFREGDAFVVYMDESGQVLGQGQTHAVTPLETFVLNENVTLPPGTKTIQLRTNDSSGGFSGVADVTTDVEIHGRSIRFSLDPQFPNPVRSSTTINARLSASGEASLKIYDMLGREVATLMSGHYPAGVYPRIWDARNMPNGVYVCCLNAGGRSQFQKIVVLK